MSEIKTSSGKVEQTPIINNFKNPTKQDKLAMKLQKLGKSVILTEELSILLTKNREGYTTQVKPWDDKLEKLSAEYKKEVEKIKEAKEKIALGAMQKEIDILEHRHDKKIL